MSISSAIGSLGFKPGVCTSTTRPAAPYEGQLIFETDTDSVAFWDGSYWRYIEARKNLLYNGAMQVHQRIAAGTGATGISAGLLYHTADRWATGIVTLGTWTQSVENDAPTGSGFRKSLKMLCTTPDTSPTGGDYVQVVQWLEGQDLQSICKGTSSAQQLTVSFWVKANVTGTYIVGLYDNDNARFNSQAYTISSSATWEFKTVTFPADTTGTLDNDNAASLRLNFWLAAGGDFKTTTLATTWTTATTGIATGLVNLASATNNYWQVTGVQLNVGSVAAPFEFKSFGQELRECQRYYQAYGFNSQLAITNAVQHDTNDVYAAFTLPVTMRTAPTYAGTNATNAFIKYGNATGTAFNALTINAGQTTDRIVEIYVLVAGTKGDACWIRTNASTTHYSLSAEL